MKDRPAAFSERKVRKDGGSRVLSLTGDEGNSAARQGRMAIRDEQAIQEQARDWVVRLASGAMTAEELAAFEAWLARTDAHERAFRDARDFWRQLATLETAFDRLDREDRVRPPTFASVRKRPVAWAGAVAMLAVACVLLLTVAPEVVTMMRADHRAGPDRTARIALPDGSHVTLNRNSAIRIDFTAAAREIELLEGDVYVDVEPKPARPFRVLAGQGASEAVGTAFVVRQMGHGTCVAVTEGKVAVTGDEQPDLTVALTAGEGVRYADGRLTGPAFAVDTDNTLAWRSGKVVFADRPLTDALAELERYHPGQIVLLGKGRGIERISGVIDLDKLDEGIAALAATHGMTVMRLTPYLTVLR